MKYLWIIPIVLFLTCAGGERKNPFDHEGENWNPPVVTIYNDGAAIPLVTDSATWYVCSSPAYCYYENTTIADSIKKYGALYNWYVVNPANPKKLAPAGWHVPTDAEWDTLQNFLIVNGYNWDGTTTGNKIAKAMAVKSDWSASTTAGAIGNDLTKNNSSGFSAFSGGCRNGNGTFYYIGYNGRWWSAKEDNASSSWNCALYFDNNYLNRFNSLKSCGYSVRLVKD